MTNGRFDVFSRLRSGAKARGSLFRTVAVLSALAVGSLGIVAATATEAAAAHKTVTPTITVTPTTSSPGQYVQVSGANWTANTTVFVYLDGVNICNPTADATGNVEPVACQVAGVPAGPEILLAQQSALSAQTTLTVTPGVTYFPYSQFSPGATFYLNSGGFAGGSVVRAYLDSTSSTALVTNPVNPSTDASGNMNGLYITLPASATTGAHSVILQDGSSNKVKKNITIYKPTFTIGASSGYASGSVVVSGSGWEGNDSVEVSMGATYFCSATTDSNGAFSTACPVPAVPAGAHPTSAEEDSNNITATSSSFTVKPAVTYFPNPAASPGATIRVDTEGLAANSNVTALLGTTVLVTNPVHPSTDANGSMTNLMVTLPSNAVSGTLTVRDALGNKATTTTSVYKPKVKLSATSGSPASSITVSGKKLLPNDYLYLYVGAENWCDVSVNASGTVSGSSGYCSLPYLPAGTYPVTAQQDDGAITRPAGQLTIVPSIEYLPNSVVTGGAAIRVDTYGLAASAPVTAKLSGVSGNLTTDPVSPVTDTNGDITDLMVTVPTGVSVGTHTLTISDGTNSASQTITVLAPTVQFTASSGSAGQSFGITGSGWDPIYGSVYVNFGPNDDECYANVDTSGDLSGYCTVPSLPAGSYPITIQQDGGAVNVANGNFTIH